MNRNVLSLLLVGCVSSISLSAYAIAPMNPPVFDLIKAGPRTFIFADVLKRSGLTAADFKPDYTTFLVGRDSRCSPADKNRLLGLTRTEARRFIFSHAIKGDLSIVKIGDHVTRAYYFPRRQTGTERHEIDAAHSVLISTMGGDTVKVSLSDGKLYLGHAVALEGMSYGGIDGASIEFDRCGDVASEGRGT